MTRAQVISILVFFAILSATIAIGIAYDVWLSVTGPDNATTISWSMDLLGHAYPIVAYGLGFLSASFTVGLAVHFFWSLDSPADWDELVVSRWQKKTMMAQGIVFPDPPDDLDYT